MGVVTEGNKMKVNNASVVYEVVTKVVVAMAKEC